MITNKPTILIIENSISFTGAFKCALQQAVLLQKEYHFIFILPTASLLQSSIEDEGFKVYKLPMLEIRKDIFVLMQYIPRLLANRRRLKKIIKQERADLVIVNDFYNLLGALVKSKETGLITYVRFLPSALPGLLTKIWIKIGQAKSDKMITVSDAVLKQLPLHQNTIRVYDAVAFSEHLPGKIYYNRPVTHFLYIGNYIKGKGQDHAIRAFYKTYEVNKNIRLLFIGGDMGLQKNKDFHKSLEQYAIDNKLEGVIRFEPFTKDTEAAIKAADIVLNFSEAESFSMTVAEASYYGLPVIATRCGGPEEIIVHQKTGLLVANKNVEAMSEAMIALSHDVAMQKKYGINGREYVQKKFSIDNFTASCKGIYDMVIPNYSNLHGH